MKKAFRIVFLAVAYILPTISIAGDTYDPATGIVHMPVVSVGTENFEVDMLHQGDLVFKVTSAVAATTTSTSPDTYDAATGVVHMPSVIVGSGSFEVDMMHQGDLVFKVTSALQMTPSASFLFTTDYLNGKKFYVVSQDETTKQWSYLVWEYTDSATSESTIENPNEKFTVSYTITTEGYITYNDDNPENDYIKAIEKTDDYISLIAAYGLKNLDYYQSSESNYYYFEEQKAKDFVNKKNTEITK